MGSGSEGTRRTRERVIAAIKHITRAGILSASGHGNFSARLHDDRMVLTGGGNLRDLQEEHLAVVGLDGEVVKGTLDASSQEIVAMHTAVYRARPDISAIVHTHSPYVTAFALANAPLPARYEALLRFGQSRAVPVAAWAPRGTDASVGEIMHALTAAPGTHAVLLGNHGLLAFGDDAMQAAMLAIAMEEAALCELAAHVVGGAKDLPADAVHEVQAGIARFQDQDTLRAPSGRMAPRHAEAAGAWH